MQEVKNDAAMKKYELTDETMTVAGRELHRIRALRDFGDVKAENVAAYIKSLKAEADALKAEEASLSRRRKVKDNQIERMKSHLLDNMKLIHRQKIDTPRAKLFIRNNAESVQFDDENEFIALCEKTGMEDYLRYKAPEINKTAVKERLKSGVNIEGARLIRTQRIDGSISLLCAYVVLQNKKDNYINMNQGADEPNEE